MIICQVIEELAEMLAVNKEVVEKGVQECKCDEMSAMFNMILDSKRVEKGILPLKS